MNKHRKTTTDDASQETHRLQALSPLDGRYAAAIGELSGIFSEFGLMRARLAIELKWLQSLSELSSAGVPVELTQSDHDALTALADSFSLEDARRIKAIERETRHDVKAIEYFIREKLADSPNLGKALSFIHFALTSEDVNNLAYALMLRDGLASSLLPQSRQVIEALCDLAQAYADRPMLARTHGQPASPTTMGKELVVFAWRLCRQWERLQSQQLFGKLNGATGNYSAHLAAFPEIPWQSHAERFVRSLGLDWNRCTTQIEPHDFIVELGTTLQLFNAIALDLCRDAWGYIALEYFSLRTAAGEVGSSTMPHKINPIDFENAEGNLGVANSLLQHFCAKLPVSRWQRDLSDSTTLRNLGSAFGHCSLAWQGVKRGLGKLIVNDAKLDADLRANPSVLAEAIQSVMRRHREENAYERLKDLSRGTQIQLSTLREFIDSVDSLPPTTAAKLRKMTPKTYLGNAPQQTRETVALVRERMARAGSPADNAAGSL